MDTIPNSTVPEGTTEIWKDKKRYLWLLGLVIPGYAIFGFVAYSLWNWGAVLYIGPFLVFVFIPIMDVVMGLDDSNPPDDVIEALENDKYYRWITYLYLPIQYVGLVAAMAMIAGTNPLTWTTDLLGITDWFAANVSTGLLRDMDLAIWEKIGLAWTIGTIGGIGINTAHELGHKREANERWLSKIALAQSFYGHFYIEHNRGHHVRVATPEDPASSRLGENFWLFLPRTVWGSLKSAWELEAKRYKRKGTHPFHLGNDVLNAWLMSIVLFGGLIAIFGWEIAPYLVFQAVLGFGLLEVVNYLEHYGMLRQKVGAPGKERYERVNPSHSWNSNNIVTNVFLYHLQRHSDHHANPTRRYQTLRHFEESPTLPFGYAGCIVMAVVPPLWRRVMDPKVVAHLGDVRLANIQPGKEAKYLKKYGAPTPPSEESADHTHTLRGDLSAHDFAGEVLAAKCPACTYVYEVAAGDEHEGFAAGTAWNEIPDDWTCPDCGVRDKIDFVPVDPETLQVQKA